MGRQQRGLHFFAYASLACVVAVLARPAEAAGASSTRVERQAYTLGLDAASFCEVDVGGGCFELKPTDRAVTLDIQDVTGQRVDALVDFNDRYGAVMGTAAVCGKRRIPVPDGANHMDVILQTFTLGALGCAATQGPASAVKGEMVATFEVGAPRVFPKQTFASPQECGQQVPEAIAIAGVTDDGAPVSLDVRVLLDGIDEGVARAAFAEAARSYEPLAIKLRVLSYTSVSLSGNDAPGLISQSKAVFGGAVPKGTDIVYTMTKKGPLTVYDQAIAGGQGDCIGGIRWGNRSFIVGSTLQPLDAGGVTFYRYGTARIIAHEIGHILGAQHEMGNCVEGVTDLAPDDPTPCTLMSNFADFDSRDFGQLEGAVVRGFAVSYAKP